jgi:hypothetical protein
LVGRLGVQPEVIDLLFDLRVIESVGVDQTLAVVMAAASKLPMAARWRSFTVAGSSYPSDMAGFAPSSVSRIPRIEWTLWRAVCGRRSEIPRTPGYGDYGIVHPVLLDLDPRKITLGGKIRYTLENEWMILRGHSFKKGVGYKQYHSLAQQLNGDSSFRGKDFSWGDRYVTACANHEVKSGNLTTWISVDTNHHLTFVVNQLANIDVV